MALGGIPAIVDGLVSGLNALRGSGAPRTRSVQMTADSAGQGGVGDRRAQQQYVNVEGQVLDRTAPRGTYLNITA